MEELKKMVLAVANSVGTLSQKLETLRSEMKNGFKNQTRERKGLEIRLSKRIDKIGLQEARLEDDTPTIEEFDKLEKRVEKLEKNFSSI